MIWIKSRKCFVSPLYARMYIIDCVWQSLSSVYYISGSVQKLHHRLIMWGFNIVHCKECHNICLYPWNWWFIWFVHSLLYAIVPTKTNELHVLNILSRRNGGMWCIAFNFNPLYFQEEILLTTWINIKFERVKIPLYKKNDTFSQEFDVFQFFSCFVTLMVEFMRRGVLTTCYTGVF